ncbi:phospholipase/carboxylesterase [Pseudorhizobium tarimense]|uniref:Phospholipase/carboxylesterase n=1 Tax=Pseudorhizobium tarimense TaxID=1079109 RepID=A0ABV2HBJ2_9HYPH|nr:prolyl oligopeptidase family serine peptidase [Pseudorhizobium tarimense]MCJ8520688.1 prolyl oligopeptidase family serine peptidase [Pseudorhizobium tarimense]
MHADKTLIMLFHGIGASSAQLIPLASSYQSSLPEARVVVPDAPFRHQYGREWFSIHGDPLAPDRICRARKAFDATVTEIITREGFENSLDRVAFVGVSQGAIVSLDAVASGRWQVGSLVSFAGLLPPFRVTGGSNRTPVLLVHGDDDRTIPAFASTMAAGELRAAGYQVELDIQPHVGHTISPAGASRALAFLLRTLSQKPVTAPKVSAA